jgi:hypothetical protein
MIPRHPAGRTPILALKPDPIDKEARTAIRFRLRPLWRAPSITRSKARPAWHAGLAGYQKSTVIIPAEKSVRRL